MESLEIQGRPAIAGRAEGVALVCPESLTGWGGIDPATGEIKDLASGNRGQSIAGKILVIPGSRGSNGWSCYYSITRVSGAAPRALVVTRVDSSSAVAAVGLKVPAVVDFPADADPCRLIQNGDYVIVDGDTGRVTIRRGE
ncbi:MAG: DUF126 domain-containing protein [Candidatus Adiutrix sp.]|jgi:predicted aconitase with swiveling domain|nr:DUF126 domain-containing protein [Candidatus Adiutrix sp.]